MEDLLQLPLPASLPPISGVYFTFLNPEDGDLLPAVRECLLRIAGRLGPGLYLRRSSSHDRHIRQRGLQPTPLPANLWDFQSQAHLYNLARRENARVMLFDDLEQSLPWLEQRPNQAAREIVRYLHQLQRSVSVIFCIYQHTPGAPPACRLRLKRIMNDESINKF